MQLHLSLPVSKHSLGQEYKKEARSNVHLLPEWGQQFPYKYPVLKPRLKQSKEVWGLQVLTELSHHNFSVVPSPSQKRKIREFLFQKRISVPSCSTMQINGIHILVSTLDEVALISWNQIIPVQLSSPLKSCSCKNLQINYFSPGEKSPSQDQKKHRYGQVSSAAGLWG